MRKVTQKQIEARKRNAQIAQQFAVLARKGVFKKQVLSVCGNCGACFYVFKSRKEDGRGVYCSRKCQWEGQGIRKRGTKESPEVRLKKSLAIRGSKHWAWKGGNKDLCDRIRQQLFYRLWRKRVMERDNYACQLCGKRGGKIEVHHLISFTILVNENGIKTLDGAEACNELWNMDNAIVLCRKCHVKTFSEEEHKKATVIGQPSNWSKGKYL